MKYAITGSTGKFGQKAIETLTQNVDKKDIIALARNEAKAKQVLPDGIEIRPGSYEDEAQLTKSLAGVDRLLFISSQPGGEMARLDQHKNVVNAAKAAGVSYIAYTSFPMAQESDSPLAQDHKQTEQLITATGIKHSFLRNNWYIENEIGALASSAEGNDFNYATGEKTAGWALEREYATAAAKVVQLDDPKEVYEFAGAAHTYADLANAVKDVTGEKFEIKSFTPDQFLQNLKDQGLDDASAQMATSMQTLIGDGNLEENSSDLPDILGHSLVSLNDAVKEALETQKSAVE